MDLKLTPRLILVFILFATLLLIGVGSLAYNDGRKGLEAATITELESIAGEKEAALEEWIQERENRISALAGSPYILDELEKITESGPEADAAYERLIRELSIRTGSGQSFLNLFIILPEDGRVIVSVDPMEVGADRLDRLYFREGMNAIYTTPIYFSPELQVAAMTTAAPIRSADGQVLGVLAGRLNLDELNEIIQRRTGSHETDDAFLVNGSNLVVTQPRFIPDPAVLQVGIHSEAVRRCLIRDRNTIFADDYRGVPAIISYRWLPRHEMCLIVKIDQEEALAPVQAFRMTLIWILFGTLLTASIVSVLLARALLAPIRAMQVAAQRYSRGDLDVRLPERRQDELGTLAREFNQMAASLAQKDRELREHAHNLEQKVRERTKDLREKEYLLSESQRIANIGSWQYEPAQDRLIWSEETYHLCGRQTGSFVPSVESLIDMLHPEDRPAMGDWIRDCMAGHHPPGMEFRVVLPDGSLRLVYGQGDLVPEDGERPLRLIGTVQDITERKQAEERIRDLLVFNETILDAVPVGMLTYRISGECIFANENAASIIGASVERLRDQNFRSLASWKTSGLYDLAEQAITSRENVLADIHHLSTFGKDVWLTASAVTFQSKEEDLLLLTITDITERKQAEQALRLENERFMRFVNSNIIGIVIADIEGRILMANDYYLNLLGVSRDDFLKGAVDWRKFTPEDWLSADEKAIAELRETGICEPYEKEYLRADGTRVPVYLADALLPGPDEQIAAFILDITDRKRAEEAVKRITDDLLRSNAELEQFAYVASHDLQEPLRMISSYVQLLAKRYQGKLDDDADEFIGYAVDGAKRMQKLINDLLAYSRVGTRGNEYAPVSAEFLLEEAVANLQLSIEESGATITHDPLPVVRGDPIQLSMVFQNLLGNAIKFRGSEPPCVHIGARREDDQWIFSVRDNGIGIDSKFTERIFIIFQRLNDRTTYPGTGIGLAICKRIIQRHGGHIWVDSEPGKGATFCFTLPSLDRN